MRTLFEGLLANAPWILLAGAAVTAVVLVHRMARPSALPGRREREAVRDLLLVASVALIVIVTLHPIGETRRTADLVPLHSLVSMFRSWHFWTAALLTVGNVLLFVPLGASAALRARGPLRAAVAAGVSLSCCVETLQFLLPIGRSAQVDDVILNTGGAAVGAALVLPYMRRRPARNDDDYLSSG